MRGSRVGNALLIFLGTLLACVILEGMVRVFDMAAPRGEPGFFWQDDARFGWYHIPGASGYYFNPPGEYYAYAEVNSMGLMDREYGAEKPDDTYRILVLGDSFTEGLRIPMDASFHALVEENLNTQGAKAVEVINAGTAGWGSDQQLLFYREIGRRLQPDLVLLAFFPANDIMNNTIELESQNFSGIHKPYFQLQAGQLILQNYPVDRDTSGQTQAGADKPSLIPERPTFAALQPAFDYSALYRFLVPRLRLIFPGLALSLAQWGLIEPGSETAHAEAGPDYVPVAYGVYRNPPSPIWEHGWEITSALIAQLQREVAGDGASLAVIVLPAQEQVLASSWEMILRTFPAMDAMSWNLTLPNERITRILDDLSIPYLDLTDVFQLNSESGPYFPIDGHWNESGHRIAGNAITAWLQVLVPDLATGN